MAVTQADIDSLNAAIASGERQITLNGESITFNTTDSLIKARNDMRAELALQNATTTGTTRNKLTQLVYGGRGYDR